MKVEMEISFQTRLPLTQETGLEMWKHANYFAAKGTGRNRRYQLKSKGEADTLMDAITYVCDRIRELVSNDGRRDAFGKNEAMIVDVQAAREVFSEDDDHDDEGAEVAPAEV